MVSGARTTGTSGPPFDYSSFGRWYDGYRTRVLEPALEVVEREVGGLLRDVLAERDLARIRQPAGRVKSKPRVWRKVCKPRYVERIEAVGEIPEVIDDLLGIRLTCTNRRDIDVVREVFDAIPTSDDGESLLWLDPDSERDYLEQPRASGYRGWHVNLVVGLDDDGVRRPVTCELQVRTLLQDGWGELTHEDTYKKDGELPPLVQVLSRRIADLLATLDDIAEDLRDELDRLDEVAVVEPPESAATVPEEGVEPSEQVADVMAAIDARWRELDRPVDLAALAWELQREYGAETADHWFGSGTFKRFLQRAVPHAEITSGRHAYLLPPAAAPAEDSRDGEPHEGDPSEGEVAATAEQRDVPRVARALHRVDHTFPLLAHEDWNRLFEHLAEAWRRTGSQPPDDRLARRLLQSTVDRSATSGSPLARRHVEPVVRDLVAESNGEPDSAEALGSDYATLVQKRLVDLRLMGAHTRSARSAVRRWITE